MRKTYDLFFLSIGSNRKSVPGWTERLVALLWKTDIEVSLDRIRVAATETQSA